MNKSEAYRLLSAELQRIQLLGLDKAMEQLAKSKNLVVKGAAGTTYTISLHIDRGKLSGSIHDSNSFKFELLEESVSLK